jgi:hypothetical protein
MSGHSNLVLGIGPSYAAWLLSRSVVSSNNLHLSVAFMNKPNTNRELIDVGPRVRPSVAIEEVEDESGEFVIFLFFTWSGPEMCITETLGPIGGVLGMGEHLLT